MAIRIHDSLRKKVVPLETREPNRVAMYACGPTVYNFIHIGNARTFVWCEQIRRYLTYRGYDVTYVMNYTDVDDKIIERASLEGIPADGVTSKYSGAFEEDMEALGVAPPDILSLCTDHITEMIKAVEGLIEKGAAYETDGDVFFAVESFPDYGKLSGRSLEDMRAGERVEPHPGKRHPLDFALWKKAKEGEPSWPSPWGDGRPGWHIECSVMSTKYLGMGFDLHLGGSDLIFPHHENEIAQAEALEEKTFVRYWLHAAMVQMEAEKMSKSLGNVVLAREVVQRFPGEVARYWALAGSYRTQAAFTDAAFEDAVRSYERWKIFYEAAHHALGESMPERPVAPRRPVGQEPQEGAIARFIEAMDDDFNSAEGFAAVHDLVTEANKLIEGAQRGEEEDVKILRDRVAEFLEITDVLGFSFEIGEESSELLSGLVDYLLQLREEARSAKDFGRADGIRAKLSELGVIIEDTPAGPRWRIGAS
jgi:cysteinyl-tRNA synthetase